MKDFRGSRPLSRKLKLLASLASEGNVTSTGALSCSTSAPVVTKSASPTAILGEKFRRLMDWYEEVTGLKEVRVSQDKVLKAENRFITSQDARRNISKELAVVRDKLKDIYAELDQTSRGEDRYVTLITQEHKVLKDERRLAELFNCYEQEERENFSFLSSAVKESHEKERIQAERTKYWSIIGSIMGTMIGIAGSSINNEFKMRELRKLVKESAQATIASRQEADFPKDLLTITNDVKDVTQRLAQEQTNIMAAIQAHSNKMDSEYNKIQKYSENRIHVLSDGTVFNIDELLEAHRKESRILAAICLSSIACVFVLSKVMS
ncbi:mitochondrial potassium channel-like [Thrips palmi]|uniref:Mitochondrial potassium channel-like n=1 Tax=Thrips palmi TaxID=161013 RepID=A0A6P8YEQ3_THRPL|nr:mitochondrial potassium channel-like [Thrips palmi]